MLKSINTNLSNEWMFSAQTIENLYTTCVQNRVCKSSNEFYCYLCKFVATDLVIALKHIFHDKQHQERNKVREVITKILNDLCIDEIESVKLVLNGIIVININTFHCINCVSNLTSLIDINNHVKGKRHANCKQAEMANARNTSSLLGSSISSVNILDATENVNILTDVKPVVIFKCNTCNVVLRTDAQYKYHKMFHLSPMRYSYCNIDIINFSLQEDKTRFIHCSICNTILINDEEKLENHLNEENHCKWIKFLQSLKVFSFGDNLKTHLIDLDMDSNIITKTPSFTKFSYCQICELSTSYSDNPNVFIMHEKGKTHQKHLKSPLNQGKKFELTSVSDNCLPLYVCFICKIEFSDEKSLYDHYIEETHQFYAKVLHAFTSDNHIKISEFMEDGIKIQCTICKIEITCAQSMLSHIFGSKHIKKLKTDTHLPVEAINENLNVKLLKPTENLSKPFLNSKYKSIFHCSICNVTVSRECNLIEHLKSRRHKGNTDQFNKTNKASLSPILKIFSCQICKEDSFTDSELLEHFNSPRHQNYVQCTKDDNKFTNSINKNDVHQVNSSNSSLDIINGVHHSKDANNLDSKNKNQDLDLLINFKREKNQEKLLSALLKERKQLRRHIQSSQNLVPIGKSYIELCIKIGTKNIYNVDAAMLHKIHLGVTLSISTAPDVRFCIPCNKEMPNNLLTFYEHLRNEGHEKKISETVVNHEPTAFTLDHINDFKFACPCINKSENIVSCFACAMEIENSNTDVFYHVSTKTRVDNRQVEQVTSKMIMYQELQKTLQAIWYFPLHFFCEVCSSKFKLEINFVKHLMQDSHVVKVKEASVEAKVYEFDACILCEICWYGKRNYYNFHCNEICHKNVLKSREYLIPKLMDPVEQILNHCEDAIASILRESDETDINVEKGLLDILEMIVQDKYPKVKAHLCGSRLSRTSSDNKDLNVYLDNYEDNTCYNFKSAEKSKEKLLELQKCFKNYEDTWTIEDVLLFVRVPTIKLRHKSTNLCCNIQCTNVLEVEKSKLIRYFVDACATCRKLILFLNKWRFLCELSEITEYTISTLIIFYLQTENILPSLSSLIKQQNKSKIVAGWETISFTDKINATLEKYTIKNHLSRFFDYYAKFNYMTDVVCPFLGRSVAKENFADSASLPEEMNSYKSHCVNDDVEIFYFASPMCVQDSIELPENLTKAVGKRQLRIFRQYCAESKMILDEF